jgi:hypothetical protein
MLEDIEKREEGNEFEERVDLSGLLFTLRRKGRWNGCIYVRRT